MNKRSVNRNTIFNTIKSVSGILYPLITTPYISRVLMTENVGKIRFGNSIVSYFSLLASLGVTTYAIRECSKVRENKEKLGQMASEILSINLLSTVVAYISLFVVLVFAKPLRNYRLLICIQSASILFSTLGADWLNTAMEDFRFITIRTVSIQVLSILLLLLFVRKQEDYLQYAVISVIASSGANLANILYRRKYCKTRLTLRMNLKKHLPSILLLFSLIVSQTIYVNSDITILGLIKGDHQVGLYSTAANIYNLVNTMIASIAWVVMPQLSASFAKKDYGEINRLVKYSLNFIIVLGIPAICGLEIIAAELIHIIAGEAFVGGALALRILGFALMCSFIGGWVSNMTMLPAGREKICLWTSIFSAVLNIILNFILIPLWGLNAAALTTFVSEFVGLPIMFHFLDRRIRIEGLGNMLKGPLIGSVGIILIGFLFKQLLKAPWITAIVTIAVSVMVYIVILSVTRNEFFLGFATPVMNRIRKGKSA